MKVNDPPSVLCRLLLDVSRRLEDARQWVLWVQSVQGEPWHRQPESASPGQGGPQEVLVLLWEGRCLIISLPFQNRFFLWPSKVRSLGCHVHMEATEWSSCACLLSIASWQMQLFSHAGQLHRGRTWYYLSRMMDCGQSFPWIDIRGTYQRRVFVLSSCVDLYAFLGLLYVFPSSSAV